MMASRLTQWVPQEQKSVTMKSLQKVSKCQNMTPILEDNTHESTKTLTKEEVAYIFSLNRWGCILEEFNGRVLTLEDLYEEFDICPCGSGLVPRWFNGGSLFPSNFVTCINCAMEKFIEKGYREGVVFKDHHFSFFSATTGLECFDMESIIKGKVFPSAMSSQLFPYSFNFTIKGGDHCFGCDKMTKDWLVLNGWGWKDEI